MILTRRVGEQIIIAGNIVVTVVDVDRGKIRIGITAPTDVVILRSELVANPHGSDRPTPAPAPSKES